MLFDECCVVFQGNFNEHYHSSIIERYKNTKNVVFSSWKESEKALSVCNNVVLDILPTVPGHSNINYQIKSTHNGIQWAKTNGYKYVLKIRSDILIDIKQLISFLKDNCVYFSAYHLWMGGYLCEHIVFSDIDYMECLWNIGPFQDNIFPERHITNRFLELDNKPVNYIFPILYQNNISAYWTKRNFYLNEYINDNLFVYDRYLGGK